MALFSNRLTCCLHSRRLWKAVTVAACVRHHSSLIAELIENMDKKATWDRFYTENASATPAAFKNFEWFFGFDSVRSFILPALQSLQSQSTGTGTTSLLRVLDLGCGTSAVGPSIYRHSPVPVHVTCADISPVAVALMQQQQHAQQALEPQNPRSRLDFLELDCTELHGRFGPRSLDLIVDKGTVDSLLRSREGSGKAGRVLGQCLRALRSSGSLLQFSDEDPDARLPWLETEARGGQGGEEEEGGLAATVTVHDVGELRGVCYYCYQVVPRPRGV